MTYKAIDFSSLLGMRGFSDELLEDHFKLYQGYVEHTNELLENMKTMAAEGSLDGARHSELRRRLGWEFNGMRLHELYFGNLGGDGKPPRTGELHRYCTSTGDGSNTWLEEFKAVGSMRGIGWSILYYDTVGDRMHVFWIDEHDAGHPSGSVPLLVMDVWEHAYMTDYRTDRAAYIEAFLANVDWSEVERRFVAYRTSEVAVRRR